MHILTWLQCILYGLMRHVFHQARLTVGLCRGCTARPDQFTAVVFAGLCGGRSRFSPGVPAPGLTPTVDLVLWERGSDTAVASLKVAGRIRVHVHAQELT